MIWNKSITAHYFVDHQVRLVFTRCPRTPVWVPAPKPKGVRGWGVICLSMGGLTIVYFLVRPAVRGERVSLLPKPMKWLARKIDTGNMQHFSPAPWQWRISPTSSEAPLRPEDDIGWASLWREIAWGRKDKGWVSKSGFLIRDILSFKAPFAGNLEGRESCFCNKIQTVWKHLKWLIRGLFLPATQRLHR